MLNKEKKELYDSAFSKLTEDEKAMMIGLRDEYLFAINKYRTVKFEAYIDRNELSSIIGDSFSIGDNIDKTMIQQNMTRALNDVLSDPNIGEMVYKATRECFEYSIKKSFVDDYGFKLMVSKAINEKIGDVVKGRIDEEVNRIAKGLSGIINNLPTRGE